MSSRSKNFVFTHNNYSDTAQEDTIDCSYIVYGKEVGESGTPHLQGFVQFKTEKSEKQVRKLLPGCHVELARTIQAASDYCKKDGEWRQRGTPPVTPKEKGEAEQQRWKRYREAAEEGEFEEIPEKIRFNSPKLLKFHHETALNRRKIPDTEDRMEWYWGESGTGKSRKAREENPEAYLKNCNKWWCGYTDQDVVIIEDFDKRHDVLAHHLKLWGDRYPFQAETKGGSQKIRPTKIIVTSNYHPRDIWTEESDLHPILRRFKPIEFKTLC